MSQSLSSKIEEANAVILAGGDLDAIPRFFAPDYVVHGTETEIKGGHDTVRGMVERWRRAFPDLTVEIETLVEGDDRVAWQRTMRATHSGSYMGFPATGRTLVWRDMITSRFRDGLIVEDWVVTDHAERMLRARGKQA